MRINKRGMSLIVLVITIIVMTILASVVLISISDTNVISNANETVVKDRLLKYVDELSIYISKKSMKDISFDETSMQVTGDSLKTVITSMKDEDKDYLEILDGELVVVKTAPNDFKELAKSVGINVAERPLAVYAHAGKITESMIMYPEVFKYEYDEENLTAKIVGFNDDTLVVSDCTAFTMDTTLKNRIQAKIDENDGKLVVPYQVVKGGKTYTVSGEFGKVKGPHYAIGGEDWYTFSWGNTFEIDEIVVPSTVTKIEFSYYVPSKVVVPVNATVRTYPYESMTIEFASGREAIGDDYNSISLDNSWQDTTTITIDIPSSVTTMGNILSSYGSGQYILNLHKAENSISGYPWGANTNKITVNWLGE